jgi:hypothetical protein
VRTPDGAFTNIDAPGAGTGAQQGTWPYYSNSKGAVTGGYTDANGAYHGFLRIWATPLGELVDYFDEAKADFTVWRPSNGTFYSIDGAAQSLTNQWGLSTDTPLIGDYAGDGKTDFAVWRASTGTWYVIQSSTGKVCSSKGPSRAEDRLSVGPLNVIALEQSFVGILQQAPLAMASLWIRSFMTVG